MYMYLHNKHIKVIFPTLFCALGIKLKFHILELLKVISIFSHNINHRGDLYVFYPNLSLKNDVQDINKI